ncbi:MAG: hypothetical protein O2960_29770 [Verrucomicrobia bacterium]|nr:hypothetical protein [Verrucomicrobiota bacterium]
MIPTETPNRPGIAAETIRTAGICLSNEPEPGSIEIPYYDLLGQPTSFSRWRLPNSKVDGQKYYQAPGTGTRAYVPPQFRSFQQGGDLVIVEGEFKALSLIDAEIKSIGLPNFNTYTRLASGEQRLLNGIDRAISYTKPNRVLFLGDADTATNYEFARNALFLAKAIQPIKGVGQIN